MAAMDDGRTCEFCGKPLLRKVFPSGPEPRGMWKKRRFCSIKCSKSRKDVEYVWTVEDRGYDTPCWIWGGSIASNGYGRYKRHGVQHLAHRMTYAARCGPIPDDWQIHHRCENRACVNPDHLMPLTMAEHCALHEPWTRRKAYLAKNQSDNVTLGETAAGAGVTIVRPQYRR